MFEPKTRNWRARASDNDEALSSLKYPASRMFEAAMDRKSRSLSPEIFIQELYVVCQSGRCGHDETSCRGLRANQPALSKFIKIKLSRLTMRTRKKMPATRGEYIAARRI